MKASLTKSTITILALALLSTVGCKRRLAKSNTASDGGPQECNGLEVGGCSMSLNGSHAWTQLFATDTGVGISFTFKGEGGNNSFESAIVETATGRAQVMRGSLEIAVGDTFVMMLKESSCAGVKGMADLGKNPRRIAIYAKPPGGGRLFMRGWDETVAASTWQRHRDLVRSGTWSSAEFAGQGYQEFLPAEIGGTAHKEVGCFVNGVFEKRAMKAL